MMRRLMVAVVAICMLWAARVPIPAEVAAQSCNCPLIVEANGLVGFTYRFDNSVFTYNSNEIDNQRFRDRVDTAMERWDTQMKDRPSHMRVRWAADGGVTIFVDDTLGPNQAYVSDDKTKIFVSQAHVTGTVSMQQVIGDVMHEAGHIIGFGQQNCASIMGDPGFGVYDFTACDLQQLDQVMGKRDLDNDGYFEDEDCSYDPTFDQPGYDWINPGVLVTCAEWQDGNDKNCDGEPDNAHCEQTSPIVIDVAGDGVDLTSSSEGVMFDLFPDGVLEKLAWTREADDDAWLVVDRDGNGLINNGSELFGTYTPQPPSQAPNGFIALAVYDAFGGNRDGWIDAKGFDFW